MTKIIALSGRKQSGKSTASEYIENFIALNYTYAKHKIYSFADPLKKSICMDILGLTYEQCYGSDDDKNTMTSLEWQGEKLTARRAMEIIGTDIFRQLKNNVWVDATIQLIQKEQPDIAIIPDCRFPNEVDALLNIGATVIRLTLDPFCSTSSSESALDQDKYDWNKFSLVVDNSHADINIKNRTILNYILDKGILPL